MGTGACAISPASLPADTPPQALARRELQAIHELLLQAHPGAIDEDNPAYRVRIETGYQQALARVTEVQDNRDAGSLARWYVLGFNDIHLSLSTDVPWGDDTITNGWHAARDASGIARVHATLPDWAVELPPLGAQWLHCDGLGAQEIFATEVQPYIGRQPAAVVDWETARFLSVPAMSSHRKSACTFRLADGSERRFVQHYQAVGELRLAALLDADPYPLGPAERVNDMAMLPDGTVWVKAGQFMLDQEGETQLAALERRLEAARNTPRIVFDARGNSGGSSDVGDRIFQAATGGLVTDDTGLPPLPRPHALWRVSEANIKALEHRIAMLSQALGEDHEVTRSEHDRREALRAALERKESWWVQQGDEPVPSREEAQRRHARLREFEGQVVLLTDGVCVSACLDFADRVRAVPGSLHLGETTDFDSVYIDLGFLKLPSGNFLRLPLKVWRNRVRADSQPWIPDIPLPVTGRSDADVQAEVLRVLQNPTRGQRS